MAFDAQIQMIVSTFKLSQTLDVDPETGRVTMRYCVKCKGGARSPQLHQTQAVVTIDEVTKLTENNLGSAKTDNGILLVEAVAPREYFNGLISLFPYCLPEEGGYLSFDFLLHEPNDDGRLIVLTSEYKMVKTLSDNPDLIQRS